MRNLCISSCLLFAIAVSGQLNEHAIQHDLISYYQQIIELPNGNRACLEERGRNNTIDGRESILVELDSMGNIISSDTLSNDSLEPNPVNHIEILSDGSQLLVGLEHEPCDVGMPRAKAMRHLGGTVLWSRVYPHIGYAQVASNDSLIALLFSDSVVVIDYAGNEQFKITKPSANGWFPSFHSGKLVLFGQDGIHLYDNSGGVQFTSYGTNIVSIESDNSGNIVALTMDSIIMFNSGLIRTGFGSPVGGGYPRKLIPIDSIYAAFSPDEVQFFDQNLVSVSLAQLNQLQDWTANDVHIKDSLISVVGYQNQIDATISVLREFDYNGQAAAISNDIALSNVIVDSVQANIGYPLGSNIAVIGGNYWVSATILNLGQDTVQSFTLNNYIPFGFCETVGRTSGYDSLALMPGSSITLSSGPHPMYFNTPSIAPYSANLCVFVSGVNNKHELDLSNNEACGSFTFPVSVEHVELSPLSFYPNPASEFVMLNISNPSELISSEIIDMQGRIKRFYGKELKLDLAALPTGVFLVRVRTLSGIFQQRLILE